MFSNGGYLSLRAKRAACVLLCAVIAASKLHAADTIQADCLIHHAQIVPPPNGGADAVAILGSRIVAVGKSDDLLTAVPTSCQKIDAEGKFLLPGFHDSHVHLASGGKAFFELKLGLQTMAAIQADLRAFAKAHPEKAWITGGTWRAAAFDEAHPPHRRDLDAAEPDRPVSLRDVSGHELWVNSAALKLCGITRDTPDPQGGRIVRDTDGEPTGVLLESATYVVYAHLPPTSVEEIRGNILKGQELALACGVTSAEGNAVPLTLREAQVYVDLDKEGRLLQRSFLWGNLAAAPLEFNAQVKFAQALPPEGKVHIVAFKGFVDGVLSSQTAAMLEPYFNTRGDRGLPKMNQTRLNELVLRANLAGFPAALHACGDRAVRMALDAFENSRRVLGITPHNRIEHVSVVSREDVPRFAKLDVIASVQPAFMFFARAKDLEISSGALGPERTNNLYLWNSLKQSGATLIYGSDFPSSGKIGPDPIAGMHCLVHRRFGDGTPFTPEERIDGDAALAGYTSVPAEVLGFGKSLGRIEPNYEADLVLLGEDPRQGRAFTAAKNPPLRVWIAGSQVR